MTLKKHLGKWLLSAMVAQAALFGAMTVTPATAHANETLFARQKALAFRDYTNAMTGDTKAVNDLKERANKGDRWAAMQYGYLAQTGKLPGLKGQPSMALAERAYNLAVKMTNDRGEIMNYNGNYMAAYNLGLMYYHGLGVPRNGATALRWFVIAANKDASATVGGGFYPAAVYAARIYATGYGVAKDPREAFKYWRMAAVQNEPIAMYELGRAFFLGVGTEKNEFQANFQLRQAAERWNVDAMYMLAQMLMTKTRFQEENPRAAAQWLLIAGMKRPQYNTYADQILAQMNENSKKQVTNSAAVWIRTHNRVPEEFDYKAPLNTDPPKRR